MIKVYYPKQYSFDKQKPYVYFSDFTIDEVAHRVKSDLKNAHDEMQLNEKDYTVDVMSNLNGDKTLDGSQALYAVTIEIYLPQNSDLDEHTDDMLRYVEKWASRSRVPGMRGDRFYAMSCSVDEHAHVFVLDEDDGRFKFSTTVLLGSMIFYNNRRAMIGSGNSLIDIANDVQSLAIWFEQDYHGEDYGLNIKTEFGDLSFGV